MLMYCIEIFFTVLLIFLVRSPVFTHLNATINGLTTIRAFGAENILRDEFDKYQDGHTSAWFMFIAASSAFGLIMDMLCFGFITLVTFSFLIFANSNNVLLVCGLSDLIVRFSRFWH